METLNKLIISIICCSMIVLTSCNKERKTGSMTVKMTDAPADFTEVNVEIKAVEVHYDDEEQGTEGWIELETKAGVYNLLELQNNVTVVLADEEKVPVGNITQMRLILGDNNTVVVGGTVEFKLKVPSAYNTGIKLNLNTTVESEEDIEIILDFDAEKSVVVQSDSSYLLKPVIEVKSIVEI